MDELDDETVDFTKCNTCKYSELFAEEYPCCDCLLISEREFSKTPEFYKKKEI